jgi:hypothetical protein
MVRRARRIPCISLFFSFSLILLTVLQATAGTIIVRPGRLDRFAFTAPESAVAGESFLVRIDPFDANGNLITEAPAQGSQFTISASGGAEVSPSRIRPADFTGGITVRVTDKVAEFVELSIIEEGAATPLTSVRIPVYPNKLDHFTVNAPKAATSGEDFQVRIIARDAFGNAKIDLPDIRSSLSVDSVGSGTLRRISNQLPPIRSGELTLSFEPLKVGKVRVVVQEQGTHSSGESREVEIGPSHLDHFLVLTPQVAVAGEKFAITVSAMDRHDNPVTRYNTQGTGVLLQPSGTGLLEPTFVAAADFRSGQAKVKLSYTASGSFRITAQESNGEMSGSSDPVSVIATDPDRFVVTAPDEAVAGEGFPVKIEAMDRYNNLIEDYDLRGLQVFLSTDGSGQVTPTTVSPSAFAKGKATVEIAYSKAESFTVIAALSREDLEKIIRERSRRAPAPPPPSPLTPEEIAHEKERELALKAREEAMKARVEVQEQEAARAEALAAREEAQKVMEAAPAGKGPAPQATPPPPPTVLPEPQKPRAPEPEAARVPLPPPLPEGVKVAKRTVQELSQISLIESKGQALLMLETTGPVSYNASTGSGRFREWIFVELFPVQRDPKKVADFINVESELVGEVQVEELDADKIKVSLQILPSDISYVVSQQGSAVVVKIIKNE